MMNTVSTINEYYKTAPILHRSPVLKVVNDKNFGVRPGTMIHKLTEEEEVKTLEEWDEEGRLEAEEEYR